MVGMLIASVRESTQIALFIMGMALTVGATMLIIHTVASPRRSRVHPVTSFLVRTITVAITVYGTAIVLNAIMYIYNYLD